MSRSTVMFNSSRFKSITWQFIKSHVIIGLVSVAAFILILLAIAALTFLFAAEKRESFTLLLSGIREHWIVVLPILVGTSMLSILTIAVFGLVMSFKSTREIKDRLHMLNRAATSFSQGNLKLRLAVNGEDELSTLTAAWNTMADRVELQVNALQRLSEENASLIEQSSNGAVLEERQRLARELHDSISQQLFAMSITSAAVNKGVQQVDIPQKIKQQIAYLEEMAASIQNEMRTLIFHLRPIQLEGKSLIEGVQSLLREVEERHGLLTELKVADHDLVLPGWENHLFRLIQEGISNVMKHAKANKVTVSLLQKSDRLLVTIEDDGVGFNVHKETNINSYGLKTMKERTQEIGGVLDLYSEPGKGTKINVFIPLS